MMKNFMEYKSIKEKLIIEGTGLTIFKLNTLTFRGVFGENTNSFHPRSWTETPTAKV